MAIALSTLLEGLGRATGTLRRSGTTTSAGSATTAVDSGLTTVVDTDTLLKDVFILLTSGTYGTLALRKLLNAYTASSGTMTWSGSLAGNSGSGVTYLLFDCDPQYLVDALNDAREEATKYLWRNIVDVGNVTGSLIFNGGFYHWTSSTVPLGWRVVTATLAREAAGLTGNAVSLTTLAGFLDTYIQPYLPIRMSTTDLESAGTLSMYADVKTSAASNARIRIYTASPGDSYYSDYHSGDGGWTQLKLENKSITKNINACLLGLYTATTDAAQLTNVYTKGGPQVYQYAVPSTFLGRPNIAIADSSDLTRKGGAGLNYRPWTNYRYMEDSYALDEAEAATTTGLVQFEGALPPNGHRMQWTGKGSLSSVSLLADTMEVDNRTKKYLYAVAGRILLERLADEQRHNPSLYDGYMRGAAKADAKARAYEDDGEHTTEEDVSASLPEWF